MALGMQNSEHCVKFLYTFYDGWRMHSLSANCMLALLEFLSCVLSSMSTGFRFSQNSVLLKSTVLTQSIFKSQQISTAALNQMYRLILQTANTRKMYILSSTMVRTTLEPVSKEKWPSPKHRTKSFKTSLFFWTKIDLCYKPSHRLVLIIQTYYVF